ncbi:MAG TPA: alpha/beta hydrolase [Phenylobacterium sp.]|nr:alpha/beta hydrolase [Phenylobacterium sp.]
MDMTAPLIATAAAPIPPRGGAEWITGFGGARLRAALFAPEGTPRGSVVLSPGRTEVIEKYFEVVGELTARGFVVLVHDWRGQGMSHRALPDRLKGHAIGYRDFLEDYDLLLAAFEARLPKPWIAVGHSMGGCLTALALAHGQASHFAGAVLSAPMLGLAAARRMAGARLLAWISARFRSGGYVFGQPGDPFGSDFASNSLTHDPARFARQCGQVAECRDLALGAPTWGWLDFAFTATGWLARPQNAARIALPLTIVAAGDDKLVDNDGSRRLAAQAPDARYVEIPGAYHEIMMETDDVRAVWWREFDDLAARIS